MTFLICKGGEEIWGLWSFLNLSSSLRYMLETKMEKSHQTTAISFLTAAVPRFMSWLVEDNEVKLSEKALNSVKEHKSFLGSFLSGGDETYICSSSRHISSEEGKLFFFSHGVLFVHPNYGSVSIPRSHMTSVKFYDGDSNSVVAVLLIEYKSSLLPHLPIHFTSPGNFVTFALFPKSKSYRVFYSQVLNQWQQNSDNSG
ncbi:unnamed protein product, partial [Staurois parvus]